ncbi:hypothetical protein GF373_15765 [bacterium]|nr:hypothetical protein [bacterium]
MIYRSLSQLFVIGLLFSFVLSVEGQMKTGAKMKDYHAVFGLEPNAKNPYQAIVFKSNAPGNVFFPGEAPAFSFQIQNNMDQPLRGEGKVELIAYGTRGIPGNIWLPEVFKIDDLQTIAIDLDVKGKGWQNLTIHPAVPETKGGYALILDLGEHGRQLLTTLVRTFEADRKRIQFPKQSLENMPPPILKRLNIKAIRYGISYYPSDHRRFDERMEWLDGHLTAMHENFVTCTAEIGAGPAPKPLGRGRPHLDEEGNMKGGKQDLVWLPANDEDYRQFVYDLTCKYGWPKGPITGFMLWNEPWEGLSISGWGADMVRYRKLYRIMGEAVRQACKDANVDVLVGGCDSSANTWDKLFPDGSEEFLPYLDFCSIHYQGLSSPCLYPMWRNREHNKGRVKIWDTESWVANTDDRFAGVMATNRAAGYDRSMGIFGGNVTTVLSHHRIAHDTIQTEEGPKEIERLIRSWPVAASVGAAQHFIGEREFDEILFKNGLPWVFVFKGMDGNAEDGTVVVVGDIDALFNKGGILYRTVEPLKTVRPDVYKNDPVMKIDNMDGRFGLYDFYGNPVPNEGGTIEVPLDSRGFFLRVNEGGADAFHDLLDAIRKSRLEGYEPVEMIPYDFTEPLKEDSRVKVKLTNMLNRPIEGKISIEFCGIEMEVPKVYKLKPREEKVARIFIPRMERSDNAYPLKMEFDAGADGISLHEETLHVNWISQKTIQVDGKLEDWKGALPQVIQTEGAAERSFQEEMWMPFREFEGGMQGGFSIAYLAYDANYFYFAAKINDETKFDGSVRFAERDEDWAFYPAVCYDDGKELHWPEDVRRFSYRRWPHLPSGQPARKYDNVLIAFNAIPMQEDEWLTHLPGRMPKFVWYKCTDYEFALNQVSEEWGGGAEMWKLQAPGMPFKHFFPRQPKHPKEGPVQGGKLQVVHEGNTRIVEAAIPWAEIPHVKQLMDAGEPVKFSYRVNHETGGPTMELAKGRSVSKPNSQAFHPNWQEHWANELAFGFEK